MSYVIKLLISVFTGCTIFFVTPWPHFKEFVFIKKEAGFKFDVNELYKEIIPSLKNKTSATTTALINDLNKLLSEKSVLIELNNENKILMDRFKNELQTKNIIINNNQKTNTLLIFSLFLISLYLIIKHFFLKKNLKILSFFLKKI
jgi:hypothetical protein